MNAVEIHANLRRIEALAKEIEDIPNFGPDVWSMQKVDEKCREIRRLCQAIGHQVGTGDIGPPGGTGHQGVGGVFPNTGKDDRRGPK